ISETLGGLALLAGFLTQFAALGIAIIMVGAIYKKIVEWHVPYSSSEKIGWEFDLLIIGACIGLMTLGSGLFGVDAMWFY
ncbi:MAG: DoxX family protein, partial [Candidatus Peribacteraceae bacterium]|nr:DoxX family protein [Candidatus Peribacteraceae bacterium]